MISNFEISSKEGRLAGWDWINWGTKMWTVKTFIRQEVILSMTEAGYFKGFLQPDLNVTTETKVWGYGFGFVL